MKKILILGAAVFIMGILTNLFFSGGADPHEDLGELVEKGALIIDTRSPAEYAGGHIEGAINIPYDLIVQKIGQYETNLTRQIIVYCHSGMRSAAAKKALLRAGYENVVNGGGLHHMQKSL